jgi:hypothetical protein
VPLTVSRIRLTCNANELRVIRDGFRVRPALYFYYYAKSVPLLLLDFEDSLSMYSIKEKHIHNVLNGRSPLLLYLNIFRNKNNQGQLVHLTSTAPSFEIN